MQAFTKGDGKNEPKPTLILI